MNISRSREEDIIIGNNVKRCKNQELEKVLMNRINSNGIRSKKINQDYFDCIYNGDCKMDRYEYSLNWLKGTGSMEFGHQFAEIVMNKKYNGDNINLIYINEINEENKNMNYCCPICKTKVIPSAFRDSNKVNGYFKHVNKKECSNESLMHWWYKTEFMKKDDRITISINNNIMEYVVKEVVTEKTYNTSFGDYRPDVTIITNTNERIFIEYQYTNKKDADKYFEKWCELNSTVIELSINDLINTQKVDKKFTPLFYNNVLYKYNPRNSRQILLEKIISNENIKDIQRIKSLSMLFRDIARYQEGLLSVEDMEIIINEMNECDKRLIPKILKGHNCTDLFQKYIKTLKDKIVKYYDDIRDSQDLVLVECKEIFKFRYSNKIKHGVKYDNCIEFKFLNDMYGHKLFDILLTKEEIIFNEIKLRYTKIKDEKEDYLKRNVDSQIVKIINNISNDIFLTLEERVKNIFDISFENNHIKIYKEYKEIVDLYNYIYEYLKTRYSVKELYNKNDIYQNIITNDKLIKYLLNIIFKANINRNKEIYKKDIEETEENVKNRNYRINHKNNVIKNLNKTISYLQEHDMVSILKVKDVRYTENNIIFVIGNDISCVYCAKVNKTSVVFYKGDGVRKINKICEIKLDKKAKVKVLNLLNILYTQYENKNERDEEIKRI